MIGLNLKKKKIHITIVELFKHITPLHEPTMLKGSISDSSKHPHWWSHKFSYLTPQKATLSILPSHFTKHLTSVVLF